MHLKVQIAFGLFFIWAQCTAQSVTILDANTFQPIEYVYVSLPQDQWQTLSNEQGQVVLPQKSWKPSDSLYFEMLNYQPMSISYDTLAAYDFKVSLQRVLNQLNVIVVTASRWSGLKNEIPFSYNLIEREEIELVQPQTSADLLDKSGQVYVQKSQLGGGSPMIRGFSANRILLLVDGIRMNSAIFRSGNLHNIIAIDPRSVGQAEIYLGPASVLFGSDAIGGSINFKTIEPTWSDSDSSHSSFLFGTNLGTANNERTIQSSGEWGNRQWGWVGNFSYSQFGDLVMGKFNGFDSYLRRDYIQTSNTYLNDQVVFNSNPRKQINTGYSQWNLLQKIIYKPNPNLSLILAFHRSETSDIPRYDRLLVRNEDGGLRSAEWYYGPQVWQMIHLNTKLNLDKKWADEISSSFAFQRHIESRHDRPSNSPILFHRNELVDMVNLSLDLEKSWNENLLLQYGLEWVFNQVNSTGEAEDLNNNQQYPINSRYPNPANWQNVAGFAQLKKSTQNFSITAGIRGNYTQAHAEFDASFFAFPYNQYHLSTTNLSGGIGINYRPNQQNIWGINWSSGFRAPNFDDLAKVFDSEPGNVLVPNPNLRPERAITLDINYEFESSYEQHSFSFNVYHTVLSQALVRRDFTFNGMDSIEYDGVKSRVQAIVNASSAKVYGVGMGWKLSLLPFWDWNGHMNYQKGYEMDGNEKLPLRHAAPLFGMTSFEYNKNGISTRLALRYNGKINHKSMPVSELNKPHLYPLDDNGQLFSPAWMTLDGYFGYQISEELAIRCGIENFFNRQYRTYSSGIVAPGRNFFIHLLYKRAN